MCTSIILAKNVRREEGRGEEIVNNGQAIRMAKGCRCSERKSEEREVEEKKEEEQDGRGEDSKMNSRTE